MMCTAKRGRVVLQKLIMRMLHVAGDCKTTREILLIGHHSSCNIRFISSGEAVVSALVFFKQQPRPIPTSAPACSVFNQVRKRP